MTHLNFNAVCTGLLYPFGCIGKLQHKLLDFHY